MNGPATCVDDAPAPQSGPPTVAEFLADATQRLDEVSAILAARDRLAGFAADHGDVWTVPLDNAVHALARALAALTAATRLHTQTNPTQENQP